MCVFVLACFGDDPAAAKMKPKVPPGLGMGIWDDADAYGFKRFPLLAVGFSCGFLGRE